MSWYYMQGADRLGPVGEDEFQALLTAGDVTPNTFVWKQGMSDWQQWGNVVPAPALSEGDIEPVTAACAECARTFDVSEMIRYGQMYVCADCKPVFFQRVKEGAALPLDVTYASFGARFAAKILDGLMLWIVNTGINSAMGISAFSPANMREIAMSSGVNWLFGITFLVFFLGRFGATPGKMALGIKVQRPDGSPITYMRALGRCFAEYLSHFIFLIGYIMAAFDEEHRTLHDRICDTRVVKK